MNDERPDWLEKHIGALPREISPGSDLWPDIEGRIREPAMRRWPVAAIAASLAVGVIGGWLALRTQDTSPDAPMVPVPVAAVEVPVPAEGLDPWEPARARYSQEWPAVREQLGPETAAVIERNLEIIHRANVDLQIALEQQPDNPALRRLLRQTLAKEIDVYQRAWNASRHVVTTGGAGSGNWRGSQL
jgi:hypothetical protein